MTFDAGTAVADTEAIVAFAREWDSQPYHLDPVAASRSLFGTIVGSGMHSLMLSYRLFCEHGLLDGTGLAGLGIDRLQFLKPLLPDRPVRVEVAVDEKRLSRKLGQGIVSFRIEARDHADEVMLRYVLTALVACKAPESEGRT